MVIFSEPRHIPQYRRSPGLSPPNYKALAIGINYMWSPDGSVPGDPTLRLMGPVNDAKNMKETLKRACARLNRRLLGVRRFLTRFNLVAADVYQYREQDILLMTDEEGNRGTEMWPSAPNIVRFLPTRIRVADSSKFTVASDRQFCPRCISWGCVRLLLYAKNSSAALLSLLDRYP